LKTSILLTTFTTFLTKKLEGVNRLFYVDSKNDKYIDSKSG